MAIGATLPDPGRGLVVDAVDTEGLGREDRAVPAAVDAPAWRFAHLGRPVPGLALRVCDPASGAERPDRAWARSSCAVGLAAADVVLVAPGTLPKTSSGKLQRSLCRARYQAGSLGG